MSYTPEYSSTPEWLKPASMTATPTNIIQTPEASRNYDSSPKAAEIEDSSQPQWNWIQFIKNDARLLLITLLIIFLINVPFLKWVVYPFTIFSTYIHEMCHGIAAVLAGGKIESLRIYPDGSGLAYTLLPSINGVPKGRAFVASAGYQGTAVVGCLLLLLRRTKRGPRACMVLLGLCMVLSVALLIRNAFGIVAISSLGVLLCVSAWKLPSARMRDLYVSIAVTTALNAITSIESLYGSNFVVNGQASQTDAHSMAEVMGGGRFLWATIWLFMGVLLTLVGLVFCIPGPDEVASFHFCWLCKDWGCFALCNWQRKKPSIGTEVDSLVV